MPCRAGLFRSGGVSDYGHKVHLASEKFEDMVVSGVAVARQAGDGAVTVGLRYKNEVSGLVQDLQAGHADAVACSGLAL